MVLNEIIEEQLQEFKRKTNLGHDMLVENTFDEINMSCNRLNKVTSQIFKDNYILTGNFNINDFITDEIQYPIKNKSDKFLCFITDEVVNVRKKLEIEINEIINDQKTDSNLKDDLIKNTVNKFSDELDSFKSENINFDDFYENFSNQMTNRFDLRSLGDANYYFRRLISKEMPEIENYIKQEINKSIDNKINDLQNLSRMLSKNLTSEKEVSNNKNIVDENIGNLIDQAKIKINMDHKFNGMEVINKTKDTINSKFENIFNDLGLSNEEKNNISNLLSNILIDKAEEIDYDILEKQYKLDTTIIDVLGNAFSSDESLSEDDYVQVKEVYSESKKDMDSYPSLEECYIKFKGKVLKDYNIDLDIEEYVDLNLLLQDNILKTENDLKDIINDYIKKDKERTLKSIESVNTSLSDLSTLDKKLGEAQINELLDKNTKEEVVSTETEYVSAFK